MPTLLLRRFQTLISSIHNKNFVKILKLKISCLFVSVKNVLRLRNCSIGQLVRHNISKNMKPCKKMYFIFYLEKVFMTKKQKRIFIVIAKTVLPWAIHILLQSTLKDAFSFVTKLFVMNILEIYDFDCKHANKRSTGCVIILFV